MPAAQCDHTARYKDGHCKVCTRRRRNIWQRARRAAQRDKRLKTQLALHALGVQDLGRDTAWELYKDLI